jgi:hypothetical protein
MAEQSRAEQSEAVPAVWRSEQSRARRSLLFGVVGPALCPHARLATAASGGQDALEGPVAADVAVEHHDRSRMQACTRTAHALNLPIRAKRNTSQ